MEGTAVSKRKWKLPAMSLLLFLVLLADGALAGTVFAIARHQSGTFQSSTIQASTAQPRQVALTFDDGPSTISSRMTGRIHRIS